MKKLFLSALASFMVTGALAQVNYDATITAIYGSGNPDGEWNSVQENGIVLGIRAKERWVTPVMNHVDDVYYMPLATPQLNRSSYNIELSAQNLNGPVGDYDYYLRPDRDASVGVDFATMDVLNTWVTSSYGDSSTGNGQGVEGLASTYAGIYSIIQVSQNIGFGEFLNVGITDPAAESTRDYLFYAVAKGAGPDAEPLASARIQVITGDGGASIPELIAAIDTTGMNHGDYVNAVKSIAKYLFDGGVINNKEMAQLISAAAKSSVGK